jgi:single-strand DNA-binding protein
MNAVHLTGKLTQDFELQHHGETTVAQMRLAVPRGRDKDGKSRGTDFVDVVCFAGLAEVCAEYLAKGRRIAVDGRFRHREWTDNDGNPRQKLDVIANSVEFLDRKPDQHTQEEAEPAEAAA